ncbi:SH3 domain-containing protein [Gemmobacter sp.]|uniref:SH3 domain-containing protein n=1 Tax=Gemmobacter sp. TaxID=1898957 RepID=UPI00391CC7E0
MRATIAVMLALGLGLAAAPALRAAEVTSTPLATGTLVRVTGEFHKDDARKLKRALLEAEGSVTVLFDSPGGSLIAGLEMGRALRTIGATTAVADGATCASACGLAWLGGERRMMGERARVGFHAAYYVDDSGRKLETGQGNALIGAYLNQLGLSDRAVLYITGAAPADMAWLNPDDAEDVGIAVRRMAAAAPQPQRQPAPPPQPAPQTAPPVPPVRPPATDPASGPGAEPAGDGWQVVHHAPAGYMNVRAGPGTQHPVLFTLLPSQPVRVTGCRQADPGGGTGRWCLILAGSSGSGWISRVGLEPLGTTQVPEMLPGSWQVIHNAQVGYMNVRAGAGVNHPVRFTVNAGVPVAVMNCRLGDQTGGGVWCRILSDGREGWVLRSGLEPEGTGAASGAAPRFFRP